MNTRSLDFIGIGAAKSGTTSLFNYLRHHPQIYIPPEKELPFFSSEQRLAQGWEQFVHEFFSEAPLEACWGKITPQYMADPEIPGRIFRMMPKVKLIALLRNPVDRAVSYYRMVKQLGYEQRTFEEVLAIQLADHHLAKARHVALTGATISATYLVRGEYGRILKNFLNYFSPEQLLVVFTDDLELRPQTVLDSIMSFLDLPDGFTPPNMYKRYYRGGSRQRFPRLIPVARHIFLLKWIWQVLPIRQRRVIYNWYKQEFNVLKERQQPLSPETRTKLVNFYREDIQVLEGLIGQKVPWIEFQVESIRVIPN